MTKRGPKGPSKWTKKRLDELADDLLEWIENDTNFNLGRFAKENGFWREQATNDFVKKSEKFSYAWKLAQQHQESVLFEGGLTNALNANMAKFGLSANHNWKEKSESDVTSDGEKITGITVEFVKPKNES